MAIIDYMKWFLYVIRTIPMVYCCVLTVLTFTKLPPLCSFTTFTISDCLVLDDMHYARNFIIISSFCTVCSGLVIYRHTIHTTGIHQYELSMIVIHLLSTLSFILSLIFVKFAWTWKYHRICGYSAYVCLLLYQTLYCVLYYECMEPTLFGILLLIHFVVTDTVAVLSSILFAMSRDRLYLAEWISYFAILWFFAFYGCSITRTTQPIITKPNSFEVHFLLDNSNSLQKHN
eukprot:159796_1